MTDHIQQTYQILDEISHVRARSGIFVGSTVMQTATEWIFNDDTKKMEKKEISYIPAFIKVFSEILDNAIDESKRSPDVLSSIKVSFDGDSISVQDDGKGIPVEIHPQTNQYVAETIFSNLRAGSNFNDSQDQALIGTNGLGSTLCVILSQYFKVESCDGKKMFKQEFWDGMRERSEPKIYNHTKHGTKITFSPDYTYFKITGLDKEHKQKIYKKVIDAAACNLNVNFYFNDKLIKIKSFDDYIKLYSDEYLVDFNDDWKVGITHSDGFEQISFVNSVETYQGGTHVNYVSTQIVDKLREYFKKKYKIDVKPSDIKNHLRIFVSANINRPNFSSQTKENMISAISDWKTSWTVSDKFIKKLVQTEIIQSILDWVQKKEDAQLSAELRKLNKNIDKNDPKKVEKFHDATSKNRAETMLLINEGDSAMGALLSGRDSKTMGVFPLKGVPINVYPLSLNDIKDNVEFKNLMIITGLQFGVKVNSVDDLRFGKLVISTDSDKDGHKIRGLLLNAFYKFWPELFTLKMIYILNTPIVKVNHKKSVLYFYTIDEFVVWKNTHDKCITKYLKGLGTSNSTEWKGYLSNLDKNLELVVIDDDSSELFKLQFSKDSGMADNRKDWLGIQG